jgi:cytochrome P450
VTDPNLVKEILTNKLYYKEPISIVFKLAFFGEGLFTINGKDWTERRQIMEHAFHHEALKVPFQTINNKDDKQILLNGKSYALNVKHLNMKIIALVII